MQRESVSMASPIYSVVPKYYADFWKTYDIIRSGLIYLPSKRTYVIKNIVITSSLALMPLLITILGKKQKQTAIDWQSGYVPIAICSYIHYMQPYIYVLKLAIVIYLLHIGLLY